MGWPASAVATNDPVTALQCNSWHVKVAAVTLAVDTASITLSAIPQCFKHIVLMGSLRSTSGASAVSVGITFNAITGADGYPAPFGIDGTLTTVGVATFLIPAASAPANRFGAFRAIVPNYTAAATMKSMLIASGYSSGTASGSGSSDRSVMWRSTAGPVTQIVLASAASFKAGSTVTLYATGAR